MKKSYVLVLSLILMVSVFLAACGGKTNPTAASGTNSPQAASSTPKASTKEKVKLKVAMPATMFLNLPEYLAQKKGFFQEENLEVEFLNIADSSVPVKNLIAGDVDLVYTGTSETLIAAAKGAKLKVLGGVNLGLHYGFYVGANSGIKNVSDIVGKKVAISSPGSLPRVSILALLNKEGVSKKDIDKITWVPISGSSGRVQGVIAGKVDATVSSYSPEALQDPNIKMLFIVPEKLPEFVMTSLDTTDKVLAEKRDAIKRFIRADLKAVRYIMDNKKESLDIAKGFLKSDDAALQAYYDFYTKGNIWRVNGEVKPADIEFMQKLNNDNGLQDKVLPTKEVFDGSLVEEVLTEIGRK
jgi:NitT/TauT family transport system substrate-binding protein